MLVYSMLCDGRIPKEGITCINTTSTGEVSLFIDGFTEVERFAMESETRSQVTVFNAGLEVTQGQNNNIRTESDTGSQA